MNFCFLYLITCFVDPYSPDMHNVSLENIYSTINSRYRSLYRNKVRLGYMHFDTSMITDMSTSYLSLNMKSKLKLHRHRHGVGICCTDNPEKLLQSCVNKFPLNFLSSSSMCTAGLLT